MIWVEFIGVAAPEVEVELVIIVLLHAVEYAVVLLAEVVDSSLLSFTIPIFYLLLFIFLTPTLLTLVEEEEE